MGKIYPEISEQLKRWIEEQKIFFVATAPLSKTGHVNVSPKGMDTFRVLSFTKVAYLDFNGSGIETSAHLKENGRITVMFTDFTGRPNIVRLYGTGTTHLKGSKEFDELASNFPNYKATRSIITIELDRIQDSCGFSIPRFDFVEDRLVLEDWAATKSPEEMREYQQLKNAKSIDGLEGI